MTVDQLREYCLGKKGASEDFPFDSDTLVFKVLGKMFALFPLEKWEAGEGWVNLKCDPDYALELREAYESVQPGWHMNKSNWNTVLIYKGELSPRLIMDLIDHSYNMVVKGMPKKMRESLQ